MPSDALPRFAVLIPAYKPSAPLVETVRALAERFAPAIVVVDDGSGPEYRDVFATVAAMPGVQVVRHATNLGKGAALKTGIDHALRVFPGREAKFFYFSTQTRCCPRAMTFLCGKY